MSHLGHELLLQLAMFAAALLASLLSALAGGGAGLVQLPVLILPGLPFPLALATHKLASVWPWAWGPACARPASGRSTGAGCSCCSAACRGCSRERRRC